MLNKIISLFRKEPSKVKTNVKLRRPPYVDRHKGRDFLIIATGPSIKQNRVKVQEFIDKYRPVVMAGNFIDNMFVPDYHAYVNRGRFCNYVKHTSPESRVLLSPYFADGLVRSNYKGEYEEIQFENIYPSEKGDITISDGIIYAEGGTIGTILMAVAAIMGANNIFIAGMDGYSKSEKTHHYNEEDDKKIEELLQQERSMNQQLSCLEKYIDGEIAVITPTAYEKYYKPVETFLEQ